MEAAIKMRQGLEYPSSPCASGAERLTSLPVCRKKERSAYVSNSVPKGTALVHAK
jgi:hypothetical protein